MSDRPRLGEQLCYSIYSTSLAIKRLYKPLLDEMGVTYPQYLVLNVLWEHDKQTIGHIGDTLSLETSTLTPLLKRLESEGFIRRERSPEDERKVVISLLDKGKALEAKSLCLSDTLLCSSGLALKAIQRLNQEIIALRTNIVQRAQDEQ
ncbi:Putative transcriptional regulator [Sodalis praecaptivus]|uniref:Putative transcriptional regulator n=1 Tax=Sodalis praecaptivus TaxID=1239307 RepID=W0HUA4_9GAMM|nr:MarR family transcriptional regulator [Sodalis praecaptivus]AHF75795.1 Putative transcriptional regulator [Sodalis praecaptivus]OIV47789.1 MarR family transcriptional regulator [Sodalis sp. TME1]